MKTKIITDSTCCLPKELLDEKNISYIESKLRINGSELKDLTDIEREEFITKLEKFSPYPKSTLASPQEALSIFKEAISEGYENILYLGLSPAISNQFNTVKIASQKLNGKVNIKLYETGLFSASQGAVVFNAYKMLNNGHTIAQTINKLEKMKNQTITVGVSSSFKALFRTGKVPNKKSINFITSLLNLKPIYKILPDEEVQSIGAGIGYKRAINKTIKCLKKYTKDNLSYNLILSEAGSKKYFSMITQKIKTKLNIKNVYHWKISPVVIWGIGPDSFQITLTPRTTKINT